MLKPPKWLIKFIGNIYIHKFFPYVIYKPQTYKVKGYQTREVVDNLKTGDLVFRRYDGFLSSFFIPGIYSHVGLCVDNQTIVHSIGKGVTKEDILTFCRTDSIAIARPKVDNNTIQKARLEALKQNRDKVQYDYEFKADNGAVYCTELVNICYGYIFDRDFKKIAGELILTPDDLFSSGLCEKVLEFKN